MKKVITALLNKNVNEKLKEYEQIEIPINDIQYQDGIIEALEMDEEIDFVIISELLPGEYNLQELINKIKHIKNEIKIIIILEKENKELENYLLSKGNINIFYNNEIKIQEIAELIINKNKENNLELEIEKLKEMIMNKNIKNETNENDEIKNEKDIFISENEKEKIEKEIEEKYKIKNKLKENKLVKKIINIFKKEIINNSKLIIITGINGIGKSVFTVNLVKQLKKESKTILIIDFDFLNNSIQTLFGIKNKKEEIQNYFNQEINLENLIIKIDSNIELISKFNLLFSENNYDELKLLKIIKQIKLKYNFIIIDSNYKNNYLKTIIKETDKIIFLTEPNILQIKKTKNILEKYINKINTEKEKLYILFNKVKKDSLGINVLKNAFKEYNIIGKINFIKNYNILINHNMKKIFLENKIKKQYKNIIKKLYLNNNLNQYYLDKINK